MPVKPSMRSWGTRFDTLPTSPPVSPPAAELAVTSDALVDASSQKKEGKMPHDASVFVGSLPSAIDQPELTRLLSEHLSEHTEVKNIKVVRDSKGGVCAFVQCEDAASAATLIHTLHSNPPKTFLGRTLRYEPARAFRTLLISYRTPVQYVPFNRETRSAGNSLPKAGQTELDLPTAMRAWKQRNSKFVSLLYNDEAIEAENHSRNNLGVASENPSLFLQPVTYDAETIRRLAAYFGRLECFDVYDRDLSDKVGDANNDAEKWKLYPSPHDGPRSPGMDVGCWEIKWDHRDDCVSALTSLRRIPHLTVTWAHQPPPFGFEQRSPYPNHPTHLNAASYPMHAQPFRSQPASSADLFRTIESGLPHTGTDATIAAAGGLSESSTSASIKTDDNDNDCDDNWIAQSNLDVPPGSTKPSEEPTPTKDEWSVTDFPPLGRVKGETTAEHSVWGGKMPSKQSSPRFSPSTASQPTSPREDSVSFATLGGSLQTSFQPNSQTQELEMPPTPAIGMSPITPKTPGSLFPITPTDDTSGLHPLAFKEHDKEHGYQSNLDRNDRELDPTTLFVGGLETFGPGAWDETKVEKFFARFGGLESVKLVRPANSHAAFAFVKFNNTESPSRAVFEEHNRVYEGRAMRVQLRECNPPRGPWKHNNRGRGRFQSHFNPHRIYPDHPDGKRIERSISQDGHDHADAVGPFPSVIPSGSSDDGGSSGRPARVDKQPEEDTGDDCHGRNQSTDSPPSTPEPSAAPLKALSQSEGYREWYDEPLSAALTPPPSSFSSSTSATVPLPTLSYPISNGYYAPPPWMHPYAQQMPYPMPYFPFPGYPMSGQPVPQVFAGLPGTDTSSSTGAVQTSWPSAMYGSYIPYPTQQATQPASAANMESQQLNSRAPLAPTGFIQNEHGTLIAVYQPEALDRYMAGSNRVPPAVPQHPIQANWPSFPPSHSYPFPAVPPPLSSRPIPSSSDIGWSANPGFASLQGPHHIPPHLNPPGPIPAVGFRGAYNDMTGQVGGPGYRRPALRRDQGHTSNHVRPYQPRSFPGRHARGNMSNAGYGEAHLRTPQNSNDWSHWSAGR